VNTTNGPQILSSEKDIPELLIKSWWGPQQFQDDGLQPNQCTSLVQWLHC
jgi:hypothetical protein